MKTGVENNAGKNNDVITMVARLLSLLDLVSTYIVYYRCFPLPVNFNVSKILIYFI